MAKEHITKQDHGDGYHTETTKTSYPSGGTKEVVVDTSDRTLLGGGDHVESVTRTDSDGNSVTKRY